MRRWFTALFLFAGIAWSRDSAPPMQSNPFGSPTVFNTANSTRPSGIRLTASTFAVTYGNGGNGEIGTALLGSLSGSNVGFGSPQVYNTAGTSYPMMAALGPDKIVTVYPDLGNGWFGTAIVGTVSGSTITYGTEYVFNNAYSPYHSICALGTDKFVAIYRDDGNGYKGTARVGTVSGSAITFGTETVFDNGVTYWTSVAALDASRFILTYVDYNGAKGVAVVGTVSGTAVSFGAKVTFNTGMIEQISVAALGSTTFLVGYRDVAAGNAGNAVVGTISGTTISLGSEVAFNPAVTNMVSVAALDSTHAAIAYRDDGNGGFGTTKITTVAGTTATFGSPMVFHAGSIINPWLIALDASNWVVLYLDTDNGYYGTAVAYSSSAPGGVNPPPPPADDHNDAAVAPSTESNDGGSENDDGSCGLLGLEAALLALGLLVIRRLR